MDELKRVLRTKAEEMRVGPDLPAGLRQRARRKRLANAAVAAAVVGAVGFGSFTGFRFALEQTAGPRPVAPAGSEERGIPSIFPEPHLVPQLQRDADTGDAAQWRDPQYVAMRFAMDVMGWERDVFRLSAPPSTPGRIAIWNPMVTLERHARTILTMERYENRDDGISMVTMAQAPDVRIESPTPWSPVRPGQLIQVRGGLGFHHEGGGLGAEITTVPGGTPTSKGQDYAPEFAFEMPAPAERAVAASFTMYDAEGTYVARTAFRLQGVDSDEADEPQAGPTPGPTPTSDDATPAPVLVELSNASTRSDVPAYLTSLLANQGRGRRHGGYRVTTVTETEGSEVTVIFLRVGFEDDAARLSELFFPDADLRLDEESSDPVPLRVVVGEDFGQRHADALEALALVQEFSAARRDADRADRFLGPKAATYYHGDSDASLYGYAKGCDFEVLPGEESESPDVAAGSVDEFYIHICRMPSDVWSERVRVAPIDGELMIVDASLVAIASS
jgi:hypothetical protein